MCLGSTVVCVFDGYTWPCPFVRLVNRKPIVHRCKRCGTETTAYEQAVNCYESHSFSGASALDSYACV